MKDSTITPQPTHDELRHFTYFARHHLLRVDTYGNVPDPRALAAAITALTNLQLSLIPDDDDPCSTEE